LTSEPTSPLPPRPPRSLLVHFVVDTAVTFLAVFVLGLILGIPILVIAGISIVIGAVAAPSTRRAEIRALAAREHGETGP
jgi:hypothetical protein